MRYLGKLRRKWLAFAVILGNIQMIFLLSLIYWTMVALLALPFKIAADPLDLKSSGRLGWIKLDTPNDRLSSMKKQG